MICPNCGVLLPDNTKVCGKCGHKFADIQDFGKTIVETESGGEVDLEKTVVETNEDLKQTEVIIYPDEKPIFGWLVIIEGPQQWKEFRIPDEEAQYFIGKDPSCTIQLKDPSVEKFHASIRIKSNKIYITDLDTNEGTFLNEKRILREEIKDGDIIKIGSIKIKFKKF